MESNVPPRLPGWEIHGFQMWEDLNVAKIMEEEAKTRWLRPNEIYAILYNSSYFNVLVKPVNLPKSGTVVLFDRTVLRHFRRDGHNWKKKKDRKTIQEAHERIKVHNVERLHVYYAHGEDNPNFVRRCYWLLDKNYENIVLVHYRETTELRGSPVIPANSSSASANSVTSAARIESEDTNLKINHACYSDSIPSLIGKPNEFHDRLSVMDHDMMNEIDTLKWADLYLLNDPDSPQKDEGSFFVQHTQPKLNDPIITGDLPSNILNGSDLRDQFMPTDGNSSMDFILRTNAYSHMIQSQMDSNLEVKKFETDPRSIDEPFGMITQDGEQTQESYRERNCIMSDASCSLDGLLVTTGHVRNSSAVIDDCLPSIHEHVFSITEVSPAWAFSNEETKVIIIGNFHVAYSHLIEQSIYCIFGDRCVTTEMIRSGIFRCMLQPSTPGFVHLYLSLDGKTPISQVMTFEYRAPPVGNVVTSLENKSQWEELKVQIRLSHLLFSSTNIFNILSSKLSPNSLDNLKEFEMMTSSTEKDWVNIVESIENDEITLLHAKNNIFELILKNKLQEWLLGKVVEGCKTTVRDHQGLGVIHLCAILDYRWVVHPYSQSGLSLDFRDSCGWTALHWAAFYGRKEMVAVLLIAGADPSLVTDPTSESPGGLTAADIASKHGYTGLAAYLAEQGLTRHFKRMNLAGNIHASQKTDNGYSTDHVNLNEEELCLEDSLEAYRTAANAAASIQAAFRANSLKLRTTAVQSSRSMNDAWNIVAAMKIQHAFRSYDTRKKMRAVARIQYGFRTWKVRKEFLNLRQKAIKIQAAFRAHHVRRQYRKILWSVGVLEKAVLRWRLKRKGFRGLHIEQTEAEVKEENGREDFFKDSRKQANERIDRSVVKVQALIRSYQARQEYRRMKLACDQAKMEHEHILRQETKTSR